MSAIMSSDTEEEIEEPKETSPEPTTSTVAKPTGIIDAIAELEAMGIKTSEIRANFYLPIDYTMEPKPKPVQPPMPKVDWNSLSNVKKRNKRRHGNRRRMDKGKRRMGNRGKKRKSTHQRTRDNPKRTCGCTSNRLNCSTSTTASSDYQGLRLCGTLSQPYEPDCEAPSTSSSDYSPEHPLVSPGSPIHILRPNVSPFPLCHEDPKIYERKPKRKSESPLRKSAKGSGPAPENLFPLFGPDPDQQSLQPTLHLPREVLQEIPPPPELYRQLPPPPLPSPVSFRSRTQRRQERRAIQWGNTHWFRDQEIAPPEQPEPELFGPREADGSFWSMTGPMATSIYQSSYQVFSRHTTIDSEMTYNAGMGWIESRSRSRSRSRSPMQERISYTRSEVTNVTITRPVPPRRASNRDRLRLVDGNRSYRAVEGIPSESDED